VFFDDFRAILGVFEPILGLFWLFLTVAVALEDYF
jgi:hypothetical protein